MQHRVVPEARRHVGPDRGERDDGEQERHPGFPEEEHRGEKPELRQDDQPLDEDEPLEALVQLERHQGGPGRDGEPERRPQALGLDAEDMPAEEGAEGHEVERPQAHVPRAPVGYPAAVLGAPRLTAHGGRYPAGRVGCHRPRA